MLSCLCFSRSSAHAAAAAKVLIKRAFFGSLTPDVAGRRAAALAAKRTTKAPAPVQAMETLLSHSGMENNRENIPMAPPLHLATTYTRPADGIYREGDFKYARMDNPTRLQLEKAVFELECIHLPPRQEHDSQPVLSYAFASGLAGVTTILLAHSSPLTVLLPDDLYHGVSSLLVNVFCRHGVSVRPVDMRQIDKIVDAVQDVESNQDVLVWMESPSNPKCHVLDIEAICEALEPLRESKTITTVVDGTMASPILSRPLEVRSVILSFDSLSSAVPKEASVSPSSPPKLGVDISFHSGTKYLAGHSDALLGLVTLSPVTARGRELMNHMSLAHELGGAVASPWDSWLTLRGMRTLHVRLERQCQTTQALVEHLERNRERMRIKQLYYPGLASHPQHDIAKRQMHGGFGGVFSLEFHDEVIATAFAGALQTICRATSLGGPETLIEHRASIEPPERRTSPPGLLRVSVGLENVDDLINDFEAAVEIMIEVTG